MSELEIEASSIKLKLTATDSDGNSLSEVTQAAICLYDTQIRVVIADGPDVMIERGYKRTRFYIHPHDGDPIAMIEIPDDWQNKVPIVHLNQDETETDVRRDL